MQTYKKSYLPKFNNGTDALAAKTALSGLGKTGKVAGAGLKGLSGASPYIDAALLALQVGNSVEDSSRDEYGQFYDKTSESLNYSLNPYTRLKSVWDGVTTGNFEGMKKSLTFGLWGEDDLATQEGKKRKEEQSKLQTSIGETNAKSNFQIAKAQGFSPKGNSNITMYRKGGNLNNPEYEVENQEVIEGTNTQLEGYKKLASNLTKAVGETHENGGVLGKGGDRVYSDRLSISKDLQAQLKSLKVNTKDSDTYAKVAEILGKKKGKFEDKSKSTNPTTNTTGKLMLDKIEGLLNATFDEQEYLKEVDNMKTMYKKGGVLPKYFTGGKPKVGQINPDTGNPYTIDEINNYQEVDPFSNDNIVVKQPIQETPILFSRQLGKLDNKPALLDKPIINPTTGKATVPTSLGKTNTNSTNSFLEDGLGQLLNAGVALNNFSNLKNYKTNITRKNPEFSYVKAPNVFNLAKYNISKEANKLDKSIDNSSSSIQDIFARKAAIKNSAIEGINTAAQKQAEIDANINNTNVGIKNQLSSIRANNYNEDLIDKTLGENAIQDKKQNIMNTFLQGYMGNQQSNRLYDVDKTRLAIAAMDGGRGVTKRIAAKLLKGDIDPIFRKFLEKEYDNLPENKYGGYVKKSMKKKYC